MPFDGNRRGHLQPTDAARRPGKTAPMKTPPRKLRPTGPRGPIAVLLAVLLALRLIAAPIAMAAPQDGLIALCSGGQIVYVTPDGTPVDPDDTRPDTCAFCGLTLALPDIAPPLHGPQGRAHRLGVLLPAPLLHPAPPARHGHARAPPVLS